MRNDDNPDRANVRYLKPRRAKRVMSRTRVVMCLLLIIAIPIFVGLANRAVHENADVIRQGFAR